MKLHGTLCTRWLVGVGAEAPPAAWEKTLGTDSDNVFIEDVNVALLDALAGSVVGFAASWPMKRVQNNTS